MSVLLNLFFVLACVLAMATMVASLRRYAPLVADLHHQSESSLTPTQLRYALLERTWVHLRPNRGPLRHRHRPKPIVHRLHGHRPRRAAA